MGITNLYSATRKTHATHRSKSGDRIPRRGERQSRAFFAWLDGQFAYVGRSFGGRVILKGESAGVFKADKIVLIGSAGIAKRNTARNFVLNIIAKIGKALTSIPPLSPLKRQIRRRFYKRIGSDYADAGALEETYIKTISEDLTENAKKIEVPALLVWGADDIATPPFPRKPAVEIFSQPAHRTAPKKK